jgi:hypothetical protein
MLRIARRFVRYVFAGLAVCSALVCVVSIVLWARGYFVGDSFRYHAPPEPTSGGVTQDVYVVASSRGRLGLAVKSTSNAARLRTRALTWGRDRPPVTMSMPKPTPWGRLGFQFVSETVPLGGGSVLMVIGLIAPSWFVVGITAIPPSSEYLVWRRQRRARSRLERGQCVRCGYDLRETPERCPECGAAAATPDLTLHSGSGLPLVSGRNSSIKAPSR